MKKLLPVAFIVMCLAHNSFGQGSPATGGFYKEPPQSTINANYEAYLKTLTPKEQKKYRELHISINKEVLNVANNPLKKESCLNTNEDILDLNTLHGALTKTNSIKKIMNMNKQNSECNNEVVRKFHCSYSWIQRFRFKQAVNNKLFSSYIENAYDIHGDELKKMVDFYKELSKK